MKIELLISGFLQPFLHSVSFKKYGNNYMVKANILTNIELCFSELWTPQLL